MNSTKKTISIIAVLAVVVFAATFAIISLSENSDIPKDLRDAEKAENSLAALYDKIDKSGRLHMLEPERAPVTLESSDVADTLPDISKYPAQVENTTSLYIEIFSSTEKATVKEKKSENNYRWLVDMAEEFNSRGFEINGQKVSVRLRGIDSGLGRDYITSGKYLPDAFTPSNTLWGDVIAKSGVQIQLVEPKMAGNVAGVLFTKKKNQELLDKYGAINVGVINQAVTNGEISFGYTNPLTSSTGFNYLVSSLYSFDVSNPLSDTSIGEFEKFQDNIPFLALSTLQMQSAAESGVLDGFVYEYQQYQMSSSIQSSYVFTPIGIRHDSPMYAIGNLSSEKSQLLKMFVDFCKSSEAQQLATKYGFNGMDNYSCEIDDIDPDVVYQAPQIWREKKNGTKDVVAVFVADVSGSMDGQPLNRLKESLVQGMNYINQNNYIGLVTYSTDVNICVPIGAFDLNQRSMFLGAVNGMTASGSTSTFDAIAVGMKMLLDAAPEHPNAKLMLFLLSDGDNSYGSNLSEVSPIISGLKIPIYTVGYNADIGALQSISEINEAASINADNDDVVYKIASLFDAQM